VSSRTRQGVDGSQTPQLSSVRPPVPSQLLHLRGPWVLPFLGRDQEGTQRTSRQVSPPRAGIRNYERLSRRDDGTDEGIQTSAGATRQVSCVRGRR
jgi:hypothetical protein